MYDQLNFIDTIVNVKQQQQQQQQQ